MPYPELLTKPFFKFLPLEHAAVLSALVWGQKQFLSPVLYEQFQVTGLLHLLVLSGQNITLLSGFILVSLRQFAGMRPLYSVIAQISIAGFYIFVFRNEPSIMRASIMAVLASTSQILERNTAGLFILIITSGIMLAFRPDWWHSISFWLSVTATAGVLHFYPIFKKRFRIKMLDSLWVALSAQILTTPIILFSFRKFSLFSLPMNIAVAWLIEPIMVLGVALSIFGFVPYLGFVISLILYGLVSILLFIVRHGYGISALFTLQI